MDLTTVLLSALFSLVLGAVIIQSTKKKHKKTKQPGTDETQSKQPAAEEENSKQPAPDVEDIQLKSKQPVPAVEDTQLKSKQPATAVGDIQTKSKQPVSGKMYSKQPALEQVKKNLFASTVANIGQLQDTGTYFADGMRKIDFILVYEDDLQFMHSKKHKKEKHEKNKEGLWRRRFLANLKKQGLQFEKDTVATTKKSVHYVKLHISFELLCLYAEKMRFFAPIDIVPKESKQFTAGVLAALHLPNIFDQDVPHAPLQYFTAPFKRGNLSRYIGHENPDTFFLNKDRQRIAYEILCSTIYGTRSRAEVGIEGLLLTEAFTEAYPLHDGPLELYSEADPLTFNPRQVLYWFWGRWSKWYKYQPMDHIRIYFGEKVAMYFAWIGFYTSWLIPPAVIGLGVFIYGMATMNTYTPSTEICLSATKLVMCPGSPCESQPGAGVGDSNCKFWYLSDLCFYITVSYLFDNPATVFYALFSALWGMTCLAFWKRKSSTLAYEWGTMSIESDEERPRAIYSIQCTEIAENPVTGAREPTFPAEKRVLRIYFSMATLWLMILVVFICLFAVNVYRSMITSVMFANPATRNYSLALANTTSSLLQLIVMIVLGNVYKRMANTFTNWEMHRTQTEYEDSLSFKVIVFQLVNEYATVVYIAFFKGRFLGYPGHYTTFFGQQNSPCKSGGCMLDLATQLATQMIFSQFIDTATELVGPKISAVVHAFQMGISDRLKKSQWELDYELSDNEGLFDEHQKISTQFGYMTLFVSAFPLAPLFALVNNFMEIRLDAYKICGDTRRPVAEISKNIGVWSRMMVLIAQLTVTTNGMLIAFTSEFLPRMLYRFKTGSLAGYTDFQLANAPNGTTSQPCQYFSFRDDNGNYTNFYWELVCARLAFLVVFEHVVFVTLSLVSAKVEDVPPSIKLKMARERYLAKQTLADGQILDLMMHTNEEEVDVEKEDTAAVEVAEDVPAD